VTALQGMDLQLRLLPHALELALPQRSPKLSNLLPLLFQLRLRSPRGCEREYFTGGWGAKERPRQQAHGRTRAFCRSLYACWSSVRVRAGVPRVALVGAPGLSIAQVLGFLLPSLAGMTQTLWGVKIRCR